MANVIESFFISLGLDTRDYDKKQKGVEASLKKMGAASDKQTKLIAESGKKAAGAFSLLKVEVLGALAAFGMGAGFKAFIQDSMNGQAALGRLSTRLSMSTHDLQAWKLAAQEMGGSGSDATSALQNVAKGLAEARVTGTSALIQASRRFGFDVSNDPAQTLVNISRRMAQMRDPQQALQVAEAAGISNAAMQNLLLQGPDALQSRLAHTMSLTGAATKESTDQAARLQAQWADLQERFRQVGERVFNKLEPVLARLGEQFANWLDHVDWNKVINAIGRFIDKVQQIVKDMGGWKTVAEILGGILALKVLSPIIGLVFNLTRLIPLLTESAAGANALALGFKAMGVGLAALAGYKIGSIINDNVFDRFAKYATGGKDSTYGTALFDATHKFNPKTGKDEFDIWGLFRTRAQFLKDIQNEHDYRYGPHKLPHSDIQLAPGVSLRGKITRGKITRGIRNNNPGNIIYGDFARRMGATGADAQGFAIFPTAQQGIAAIAANLRSYGSKGFDTPSSIAHRWSTTDQAAYTKRLAGLFGGDPNRHLDLSDPRVLSALSNGIIMQENGFNPYSAMTGSSAYIGAKAGQAGGNSTTNDVHIGSITVQTKATDANGVAMGMGRALRSHPLIAGSVTALA